jgi:hypothetical protein
MRWSDTAAGGFGCGWANGYTLFMRQHHLEGGKKMGGVQKLRQLRAEGYNSHSLHLLLKSMRQSLDPWI